MENILDAENDVKKAGKQKCYNHYSCIDIRAYLSSENLPGMKNKGAKANFCRATKIYSKDGNLMYSKKFADGVLFAHRTAHHSSTCYLSFFLLYAREPKLTVDVGMQSNVTEADDEKEEFSTEYVKAVVSVMSEIRSSMSESAHQRVAKAQEKQKRNYNCRHELKDLLHSGDLALLRNIKRTDRKGGKSALPW